MPAKRIFWCVAAWLLVAASAAAQGPGALKTQEIYSSTGTVHIYGNLWNNPFESSNANQATTGAIRLVQGDQICWYITSTSSNACINMDSSGQFNINATTNITGNLNVTGTINTGAISSTGSGSNGIISGGLIYWTGTGYDYIVQQVTYQIGGTTYSAPQTSETLATPDPTNPRIDVFYANNTGAIGVITGTPAPNPVEPAIDPTTQVFLGFATVAAGSTTPSGASVTNIYMENAGPPGEWTCSAGTSWNCADTSNPFAGTHDIKSDGSSATGVVTLTASASAAINTNNILALELKTAANWTGKDEFWVTFYNAGSAVGNAVFTQTNSYGWNGQAGAYELVLIPLTAFNLNGSSVDSLQIKWNKGGTSTTGISIYLDNIQLEQNSVGGGSGGSSGSVTSVGLAGDGVTTQSTVKGSPITSSGTMTLQPANALPGYFVAGPVSSIGTNVALRQDYTTNAVIGGGTATISFPSALATGDIVVIWTTSGWNGVTCTDTLGNSFSTTGVGGYVQSTITVAGLDTISCTYNTSAPPGSIIALDVSGASSIFGYGTNQSIPGTYTFTPSASTDGVIVLAGGQANAGGYPPTDYTINPAMTLFDAFTVPNGNSGDVWIYAPGSTSLQTLIFGNTTGRYADGTWFDFVSKASASAAPLAQRKIVEGDLPATAISAVQSVQTFTLNANVNLPASTDTTVLSGSVTMPSDGCPCRVRLDSAIFTSSTTSANWGWWASDGTNTFGYNVSITTDLHTPPVSINSWSPSAYANGQTVTFSIHINPAGYTPAGNTVTALSIMNPPILSGGKSWMTLAIVQSKN